MNIESQPSQKEIAAAKAARIRLGLEEDDGTLQVSMNYCASTVSVFSPQKEIEGFPISVTVFEHDRFFTVCNCYVYTLHHCAR